MKIRVNEYQAEKYVEGLVAKRLRVDPVYKAITDPDARLDYADRVVATAWGEMESRYEIVYPL